MIYAFFIFNDMSTSCHSGTQGRRRARRDEDRRPTKGCVMHASLVAISHHHRPEGLIKRQYYSSNYGIREGVMRVSIGIAAVLLVVLAAREGAHSFPQPSPTTSNYKIQQSPSSPSEQISDHETADVRRRDFFWVTLTGATSLLSAPTLASAGIDVSGLRGEGGSSTIADQLKAYDGSGSRRVEEIRAAAATSSSSSSVSKPASASSSGILPPPSAPVGVATWALRASEPTLRKQSFGTINRYEGQLVSPRGPMSRGVPVSFEYPSDWLQLDKANGCIQYVDQRNGDKLYLLRVTLPASTTLSSVPKSFFASSIFDPEGSLVKSGGLTVEDYRATGDKLTECPDNACAPHRRLKLKFATVTGNGLRVERIGLVDAYPVGENEVYMLLTSSNAVKFQKGGIERETVEAIADSFRIEI